ncbi:hypothetical protein MP228_012619 [Amoeboaphelidium protococcarum]|nr:hypothetical protein MP228_012619 [Amoeboaphelidium protococcarum]
MEESGQQNPVNECCVSGYIHQGEPKGVDSQLDGMDCYISGSEGGDTALLILTDVFGQKFVNVRLVADTLADKLGIPAYVPDIVLNDPMPLSVLGMMDEQTGFFNQFIRAVKLTFSLPKLAYWMSTHSPAKVTPVVQSFILATQQKGYTKIAVAGFCFGGLHAVTSVGPVSETVKCIVSTHPAKWNHPHDLEQVKCPLLVQFPSKDFQWSSSDMLSVKEMLNTRTNNSRVSTYDGVEHGWAIRANPNNQKAMKAQQDALKEAVDFVKERL